MVKNRGHPDYILLGIVVALILLGILTLASASAPFALEKFGTTYYFLNRQILWLILGIILAFLAFRIRLDFLKKWAPILLLINLVLMGMVFLPPTKFLVGGIEAGGAVRWLNLGPISFQPAEFLKLTFILYLAAWLSSRTPKQKFEGRQAEKVKGFSQTLIAFLIVIGLISLLLIFQPDISTLGVIVLVAALMYFLANTPLWHSILIILLSSGSLLVLIKIAPYRLERLLVFLEPGLDPMGIGYHLKHALIAIGSGGIEGVGPGMGLQKLGFLPGPISDSIFAVLTKETGFVGAVILISLFLMFLWRGFKIGKGAGDKFSQLAALGITCWIVIQAFVNIGSMIGVLPLTGIPLPFISYGGSALIAALIGVGLLLNISRKIQ